MKRDWKPASDVRGPHAYLTISDDVRVVRRGDERGYQYEVHTFDAISDQWVPERVDAAMHTADLAIAAGKRVAYRMNQKPLAVR